YCLNATRTAFGAHVDSTKPAYPPRNEANIKREEEMLKSIGKTLLGATLIGAAFTPHAFAETTLNALFMAQAAYSEADVRSMTDAFTKANPDIKVNLEFVPY